MLRSRLFLGFVLAMGLCATAWGQPQKHLVVFMTDFGHLDDAVAICKGAMITIDPEVRIIDLMHDVTPYSIADGARFLTGTTPYYPAGTVFVVVIDPGVGSKRRAIVARSKKGQYFVLPDNGLLTLVQDRDGIEEVHEIQNPKWMIGAGISSTFHGRDIFSPTGAHVARGDDISDAGPAVSAAELIRLKLPAAAVGNDAVTGQAFATDGPYGNLITNIQREQFVTLGYAIGDMVTLKVGDQEFTVPWEKTFSDVAVGKPLLYVDSRGRMALAINQANFAKANGITPPLAVVIAKKK
jgi:S-adenosyl-L-methionine hydrolase (adenosine-forming)